MSTSFLIIQEKSQSRASWGLFITQVLVHVTRGMDFSQEGPKGGTGVNGAHREHAYTRHSDKESPSSNSLGGLWFSPCLIFPMRLPVILRAHALHSSTDTHGTVRKYFKGSRRRQFHSTTCSRVLHKRVEPRDLNRQIIKDVGAPCQPCLLKFL